MGKERKKSGFTKVVTPVPRTGGDEIAQLLDKAVDGKKIKYFITVRGPENTIIATPVEGYAIVREINGERVVFAARKNDESSFGPGAKYNPGAFTHGAWCVEELSTGSNVIYEDTRAKAVKQLDSMLSRQGDNVLKVIKSERGVASRDTVREEIRRRRANNDEWTR